MHIKIEGKVLREALSKSSPAATRATGVATEMFSSVKLEANMDTLVVTTVGPELQVKLRVPIANLIKAGSVAVPREQLVRIAQESETIEIHAKKEQIHISADGTTFRLNKPSTEPPERNGGKEGESFSIKGAALKHLLEQTDRKSVV